MHVYIVIGFHCSIPTTPTRASQESLGAEPMAKRAGSHIPLKGSQFVRRMASSMFAFLAWLAPQAVFGVPPPDKDLLFVHSWFDIVQKHGDASKSELSDVHVVAPVEATADVATGAQITNASAGFVASPEDIAEHMAAPKYLRQAHANGFGYVPFWWQKSLALAGSATISHLRSVLLCIYNYVFRKADEEPPRLMENSLVHPKTSMQEESLGTFKTLVASSRALTEQAGIYDSNSIIELAGTGNVDNYEWSHYVGGLYTKTRILHRANWQKTVRCSDNTTGSCMECWGQTDCWAPCSGSRCAQKSAPNSSWTRLVNSVHVRCNSGSILLQYEVLNVRGGSLQMFLDGQEISEERFGSTGLALPVSSEDYQERIALEGRAGTVEIPVNREGGHTLDIQFTSSAIGDAGVELSRLRMYMPTSFAECQDFHVCLDPISGSSEDVHMLRNNNAMQLACLESHLAISQACEEWRGCLTAERAVAIYNLLKAANVDSSASHRRLNTANSSATAAADLCINPSIQDAESWTCDCSAEMRAQCTSVHVEEEICLRAQMCAHARVCEDWKQAVGCDEPQLVSVIEELSASRRLAERSLAPVVDGEFTEHGQLDRTLGSKFC